MSAPSNCRGFAREDRDTPRTSQTPQNLRNHNQAPNNSLQRRGFAREDRDTPRTSQTPQNLRNHHYASNIPFIRRGFACEARDTAETSQTSKDIQNHKNAPSANKQSNHLHMRGLRKQSPYGLLALFHCAFARDSRDTKRTSPAPQNLRNHHSASTANEQRNHLHMRGLRKQSPYVLLLLLFTLSLHAAEDIVVRTNISPESVWVGQRMTLQIDVLGKDGWAQITDIDAVEIPNCYLLPSGNSRVRLQERIEGADYSGQRYELSLYPQRNGSIEIPALSLPVKIQTWAAGSGTNEQVVSTKPRTIEAKLPAGVQNVHSFVASSKFTATQTWSSDATDFKVGDALKRSIQLSADNLPAMLLPTIAYPQIEYLSNYPETPDISDELAQSTPVGKRNESITYVFESNGTAELPTYSFQWWNPETETLQTISLPGRSVQLTGGTAAATPSNSNPASQATVNSGTKYTIGILTILSVSVAAWLPIRHRSKRDEQPPTEKTLYQQLTHSQDNAACLQQALAWVDCLTAGRLSLSDFTADFADTSTQATVATLLRDPTQNCDLAALKSGLRTARAHYLKQQAQQQRLNTADRHLPPLNG